MKIFKVIKNLFKMLIYKIKNKICYKIFGKKYLIYKKVCKAKYLFR